MNAHKMDLKLMTHKYYDVVDEMEQREGEFEKQLKISEENVSAKYKYKIRTEKQKLKEAQERISELEKSLENGQTTPQSIKENEERATKQSEALQEAHERITELEKTLERERAEFKNTQEVEMKRNTSLVLTKVKESLSQTNVLKKKLSRTEKEKKDIKKLLDNSGNILADRLKEQNDANNRTIEELRQQNSSLKESNQYFIAQLNEQKAHLAQKDIEMTSIKTKFDREVDSIKEQMAKRLHRRISTDVQQFELNQEQIQDLQRGLEAERKLHQFTQQTLQEQKDLVNSQASELVEANNKKNIVKKKLFKASRELEELQKSYNEDVNHKVVQGQEALAKQQLALDALELTKEKLMKEKAEDQTKFRKALTEKEHELKEVRNKLLEQAQTSKENEELLKKKNGQLQIAKEKMMSIHAVEIGKKETELLQLKRTRDEEESLRKKEVEEMKKLNEKMRKDIVKLECKHRETMFDQEKQLNEMKVAMEELNKEKEAFDEKLKSKIDKASNLQKRLNHREVEIRRRQEEIFEMKKNQKTGQATLDQQKSTIDRLTEDVEKEKRKFKALVRERNAFKDEVIFCFSFEKQFLQVLE